MRTIFAEYNPKRNSIDVYTSVGYMLRIDCWEAEKDLKTTPGSDCALTHSPLMNLLNMQDYILMETCLMYRLVKVSISEPFIVS